MADSLDSGSSAHSGRAGSSPASRTKRKRTFKRTSFFLFVCGGLHLNPIEIGSKQAYAVGLFGKRKNLCDRDGGHTLCAHQLSSQRFFRRPASRIIFNFNMATKWVCSKMRKKHCVRDGGCVYAAIGSLHNAFFVASHTRCPPHSVIPTECMQCTSGANLIYTNPQTGDTLDSVPSALRSV